MQSATEVVLVTSWKGKRNELTNKQNVCKPMLNKFYASLVGMFGSNILIFTRKTYQTLQTIF